MKLQIKEELDKGKLWSQGEAAKALTTLPEKSRIGVFRNQAVVLGRDEPDPEDEEENKEESRDQMGSNESQEPSHLKGVEEWFEIAMQMAIFFLNTRTLDFTAATEIFAATAKGLAAACTSVWDKVKDWWSGTKPSS